MEASRQKTLAPAQTELKQAQSALMSRIDQTTSRLTLPQNEFTQFMTPESGDGQRQQQMVDPLGML